MSESFNRVREAIYEMVKDLGWAVIDEEYQTAPRGEWSLTALVKTDLGVGRLAVSHDREDITFRSVKFDGFGDITVSKSAFCEEALER